MNVRRLRCVLTIAICLPVASSADPVSLSREDAANGWRSLFDGKSLRGWSAEGGNWKVEEGAIVGAGGGALTYVMYRLGRDYELRVHWKQKAAGQWNVERVVCHGKVVERILNGAPAAESSESRVDLGGCGEFLKLPDPGESIVYGGIHLRALPAPSSPSLFEEDALASMQLRVRLWKQMDAYADAMPDRKQPLPSGASLIDRFRAENGFPAPDAKGHAKARLEKIGKDSVATYYRCFVPVTAQLEAYGIYIVPNGAKLSVPLVIAQHGNNGSPEAAMFYGAGNYKDMIRGAVARGYVVYAPHLVTYSARDEQAGSPIPEDVRGQLDAKFRKKGASLTGIEAIRITKALDALVERPEVNPKRIAMVGLSLGGSTTLAIAALDERIRVAVAACGFRYQPVNSTTPLTSAQLLSAIAPRPLQIQAGRRDPLVAITQARPAGPLGLEIYIKAGAKDHFDFEEFDGGHEFNGALAFAFLERYL